MSAPRQTRLRMRLPCWVRVGPKEHAAQTVNLSASGLYLALRQKVALPEVGALLGVRVLLPDGGPELTCSAEVAWANAEKGAGLGLRFLELGAAGERLARVLRDFRHTVAVLDPDPEHAPLYETLTEELRLVRCESVEELFAQLEAQEIAVLIVNDALASGSAFELFARIDERFPGAPFSRVVVSEGTVAAPVQSLITRGKLFGYLRRPLGETQLSQMVRRAVDYYALASENERLTSEMERANRRLAEENAYLRQRVVGVAGFEKLVAKSPQMMAALQQLERVRRTEATVHISGETGTGKELVARALHEGGPRSQGPFVVQNCAGLTEELLQSTLFGHRRGSFTGAIADRPGVFEQAHQGTLFLDEVAELSLPAQASLLRAVQEGEITPLGANRPVRVDVRIISATHQDLRRAIAEGRFREDLYFRLLVVNVRLPALREREGDVPLLATHFLDLHCERKRKNVRGFSPKAMRALERYPWPGNVRELENEVERLVVLVPEGTKIPLEALSERLRGGNEPPVEGGLRVPELGYDEAVSYLQRAMIERALAQSGGVVSAAAQLLGMERSRLTKLRARLDAARGGRDP